MGIISFLWINILLGLGSRNIFSLLKFIIYFWVIIINLFYVDVDKFFLEGNIVFLKFNWLLVKFLNVWEKRKIIVYENVKIVVEF